MSLTMPDDNREWRVVVVVILQPSLGGLPKRRAEKRSRREKQPQLVINRHGRLYASNFDRACRWRE